MRKRLAVVPCSLGPSGSVSARTGRARPAGSHPEPPNSQNPKPAPLPSRTSGRRARARPAATTAGTTGGGGRDGRYHRAAQRGGNPAEPHRRHMALLIRIYLFIDLYISGFSASLLPELLVGVQIDALEDFLLLGLTLAGEVAAQTSLALGFGQRAAVQGHLGTRGTRR